MKIFVINAGSSSLKFQLFENSRSYTETCTGIVDALGLNSCYFEAHWSKKRKYFKSKISNHQQAIKAVFDFLISEQIISSLKEIDCIGHRVVHGGERYKNSILINETVIKTIKKLSELAPLHNPPNLAGILACRKLLPKTPNIAVFDTAFHQTLPEKAYLYGLPYSFYKKDKIRRYGFHGINHQYVTSIALKELLSVDKKPSTRQKNNKPLKNSPKKIISCHLGNGVSVTASINGKCVDTSMGFTPLEGLLMGTRCGDIDPAIVFYLMKHKKLSTNEIDDLLNKKSGLKGLSGISSDMRPIYQSSKKGDIKAIRAMKIFAYRLTKYIGAYIAAMNGVDAIVFTAGIGEHAWYLRRDIVKTLESLGIKLDAAKNRRNAFHIHHPKSRTKVFVIPANEGLQIAMEVKKVVR